MFSSTHLVNQALVTFYREDRQDIGRETKVSFNNISEPIFSWGSRNDLPQYRESMLMDNNIMGEMINTKRSIILGQGLQMYNTIYKDGSKTMEPVETPPEIADWIDGTELYDKYLEQAANDLFIHGNIMAAINPKSSVGHKIMAYRARDLRAVIKKPMQPVTRYIHSNWTEKQRKDRYFIPISAIPSERSEYIFHTGDKLFFDGYYCHPAYWGGQEWIDLSNQIPKFHKANIRNGYAIRFHISIPEDAFLDKFAYNNAKADEDATAMAKCVQDADDKKTKFLTDINALLAGEQNAGRALFTFFKISPDGKEIPGVKIEPIEFDLKDESLIKLFEKSNQANISSMGIHPTLANIESQGKLSSGSEMRHAFEFYIKIKARFPRQVLLKPINHIFKLKGWDKKYKYTIGFEDVVLTNLDDNKSGTQPVLNPQMQES